MAIAIVACLTLFTSNTKSSVFWCTLDVLTLLQTMDFKHIKHRPIGNFDFLCMCKVLSFGILCHLVSGFQRVSSFRKSLKTHLYRLAFPPDLIKWLLLLAALQTILQFFCCAYWVCLLSHSWCKFDTTLNICMIDWLILFEFIKMLWKNQNLYPVLLFLFTDILAHTMTTTMMTK